LQPGMDRPASDSPQFSPLKPNPAPVRKASRAWPHLAQLLTLTDS